MAKTHMKSVLLLSKRAYAVAAENVRQQSIAAEAAAVNKAAGESAISGKVSAKKEEIFWMRDPKTGNWVPENHIGKVDVAEMRERLLSNRQDL